MAGHQLVPLLAAGTRWLFQIIGPGWLAAVGTGRVDFLPHDEVCADRLYTRWLGCDAEFWIFLGGLLGSRSAHDYHCNDFLRYGGPSECEKCHFGDLKMGPSCIGWHGGWDGCSGRSGCWGNFQRLRRNFRDIPRLE